MVDELTRLTLLQVATSGLASVATIAIVLLIITPDRTVKRLCAIVAANNALFWMLMLQSDGQRVVPVLIASAAFILLLIVELLFIGQAIIATEQGKIAEVEAISAKVN